LKTEELEDTELTIAEHFESATVLQVDIVGFTALASKLTPQQTLLLLNEFFSTIDEVNNIISSLL
jgi:class 3 adenylate cyclase